jgi:hypothetical protein
VRQRCLTQWCSWSSSTVCCADRECP